MDRKTYKQAFIDTLADIIIETVEHKIRNNIVGTIYVEGGNTSIIHQLLRETLMNIHGINRLARYTTPDGKKIVAIKQHPHTHHILKTHQVELMKIDPDNPNTRGIPEEYSRNITYILLSPTLSPKLNTALYRVRKNHITHSIIDTASKLHKLPKRTISRYRLSTIIETHDTQQLLKSDTEEPLPPLRKLEEEETVVAYTKPTQDDIQYTIEMMNSETINTVAIVGDEVGEIRKTAIHIADKLETDLYYIDLRNLMSKYQGETEANLIRVLNQVIQKNGLILIQGLEQAYRDSSTSSTTTSETLKTLRDYLQMYIHEYRNIKYIFSVEPSKAGEQLLKDASLIQDIIHITPPTYIERLKALATTDIDDKLASYIATYGAGYTASELVNRAKRIIISAKTTGESQYKLADRFINSFIANRVSRIKTHQDIAKRHTTHEHYKTAKQVEKEITKVVERLGYEDILNPI